MACRRWNRRAASALAEAPAHTETSETLDTPVLEKDANVCVVGAGIAAFTAARRLKSLGFGVKVVGYCGYKNLGGRLFSEEWDLKAHRMDGAKKVVRGTLDESNTVRFDTGCQWMTGSDPRFLSEVACWQKAGVVEEWQGARFGSWTTAREFKPLEQSQLPPVFCGVDGMARIVEHLAHEIGEENVEFCIAQKFHRRADGRWELEYEEPLDVNYLAFVGGNLPQQSRTRRSAEAFDYIVLAHGLATNQPRMVSFEDADAQCVPDCLKQNVRFQTLQMLTLVFNDVLPLPFDVCRVERGFEIAVVVRSSSKPGFASCSGRDVWTVFSSAEFAREFALPKRKGEAIKRMEEAFFTVFNLQSYRGRLCSNRGTPFSLLWPHGRAATRPSAPVEALFHPGAQVGVCADYCAGSSCVQSAVVSALQAADAVFAHSNGSPLPDAVSTDLNAKWEQMGTEPPWVVADFPGFPPPPAMARVDTPVPVAQYCCPTHDWLGSHPGLVFGRTAALKPWERELTSACQYPCTQSHPRKPL